MQPTAANPLALVLFITMIMTGKATAKEQELQGASSGHVAGTWMATLSRIGGDNDAPGTRPRGCRAPRGRGKAQRLLCGKERKSAGGGGVLHPPTQYR
jgi:hypothetical protein